MVHILYRLHIAYQPGGGAEKTQLLKSLVEAKFTASITDLLTHVRLWRRWLGRAEELGLSLPDPIVLMVAVQRMIDAATKIGGPQLSFRLANARQEPKVDHAATLPSVRELAEYVQAEIEDMSLTMVVKLTGAAQVSTPTPQPASSSLKAMAATYGGRENDDRAGMKPACRFWKSEDGCRRGAACTYAHDTSEMRGRCFGCGGHHLKKHCPHGLKSEKGDVKKVSKVKAAKEQEKPEQGEKGVKDTTGGEESAKELGSPPTTSASSYRESPPCQSGTEAAAELLTEATSLLKTLRSVKVLRMKELKHKVDTRGGAVGLLDGGATNGLREALPREIPRLEPVSGTGIGFDYSVQGE